MKTAIISPHTDDAIFSLGSFISTGRLGDVTIISPFAGIPHEEIGKEKHTILRREHRAACSMAGVAYINGTFLDDVYGPQNREDVTVWLSGQIATFDKIIIPLGIHHPDHIFIRDIFVEYFDFNGYYEELPYRELYPELWSQIVQEFTVGMTRTTQTHLKGKEEPVKMYQSQLAAHLYPQLFVLEGVWLK